MTTHPYLQHGLSILHAQIKPAAHRTAGHPGGTISPFITVSRETCAGATTLGKHLLPLLNEQLGDEHRSWMFLDKNLINQALTLHHLPEQLAAYLPEDRISEIKGLIGEMVGLHPPLWELEQQVAEAILKFAKLGHVILAGRAAHLITRDLPGGLHIRLVASLESRIQRAQTTYQWDRTQAEAFIHENDRARQRHVRTNFEQESGDPHTYDLVINTDRIPPDLAARLVLEALRERVPVLAP
jgi:hypothetical protein